MPYYFLIDINDVPSIIGRTKSAPTIIYKFKKDYVILHDMKKRLTILYLDDLLHVPHVGTKAGQVIV